MSGTNAITDDLVLTILRQWRDMCRFPAITVEPDFADTAIIVPLCPSTGELIFEYHIPIQ